MRHHKLEDLRVDVITIAILLIGHCKVALIVDADVHPINCNPLRHRWNELEGNEHSTIKLEDLRVDIPMIGVTEEVGTSEVTLIGDATKHSQSRTPLVMDWKGINKPSAVELEDLRIEESSNC